MISEKVRVRFAPSPTGYLHVGGLRTALYNYLFARHNDGKFILRIEDTDRNRYVEGAVDNLLSTLNWVGLEFDEGPGKDGNFGPYVQSERNDFYKKYSEQLIEDGKAYYCFCNPERVAEVREKAQKEGGQPKYDKHCLHLSNEEIDEKLKSGNSKVVRLNVQPDEKIIVEDEIRGTVEFDSNTVDDQVLIKSDGYPTYHLANVVDDHLMKITHVIRGEEWLSSTPKHILLYEYLNWELPVFAHLPLLLNPDKTKLSKRQGDVAVEDYKEKGYLPEALINFVALLGWNTADDREFFYMNDLIESFTLNGVNKSGAVFNVEKLNWLNAEHLRKKPKEEILKLLRDEIEKSDYRNEDYSDEHLLLIIDSMIERVEFPQEFLTKSYYYFEEPKDFDEDVINKRWKEYTPEHLKKLRDAIAELKNPSKEDFENALRKTAEELGIGAGKLIHPIRLAVSGTGKGPGVFDLLYILGKEKVINRINKALELIKK